MDLQTCASNVIILVPINVHLVQEFLKNERVVQLPRPLTHQVLVHGIFPFPRCLRCNKDSIRICFTYVFIGHSEFGVNVTDLLTI